MKNKLRIYLLTVCLTGGVGIMTAQPQISVARYADGKSAAVSYTFDDGLKEHYTKVFPVLKQLGLKATFCIIGSKVGGDQKGTPCMTWKQIKEMAADGQEISNHGWAHKAVIHLTGEALRHEVQKNDTVIFQHTGIFPRTYFYPGNRKTEEALSFCAQDRVGTRTKQVSIGSKRDSIWLKRWIDNLIKQGKWGVGMTHGITTGYDAFPDPQILWQHLQYVSKLQDKLWIATFHDVAAYSKERDAISLKTEKGKGYTKVIPTLSTDKRIFNYPLTLQVESGKIVKVEQAGKELILKRAEGKTFFNINPYAGEIRIYEK